MKLKYIVLLFVPILLSGCLYPDQQLSKNQIPYIEQLASVQSAIDRFQEEKGGILPIKTKDAKTPLYRKYLIDFNRLMPKYMPEPPGNAFENGGVYQYVLTNVEEAPTVKVFDLRVAEMIKDIKLRIRSQGYPPFKERVAYNVYSLDFSKIGYEQPPTVKSPYTGLDLPFMVTGQGEIIVDYRMDLYQLLKEDEFDVKAGEDIRWILLEDSVFVPAYSIPYTIDEQTKEPIFLTNKPS